MHNCKCLLEESIGNLNELLEIELLLLFVWDFFGGKVQCTAFDHLCPIPRSQFSLIADETEASGIGNTLILFCSCVSEKDVQLPTAER